MSIPMDGRPIEITNTPGLLFGDGHPTVIKSIWLKGVQKRWMPMPLMFRYTAVAGTIRLVFLGPFWASAFFFPIR